MVVNSNAHPMPRLQPLDHSDLRDPKDLYLDLMKKSLTFMLWEGDDGRLRPWRWLLERAIDRYVRRSPRPQGDSSGPSRASARREGRDWPKRAYTMIGLQRLDNIQACVEWVLRDRIPGDLIETGVWRGGACIFMRAILKAHGVHDRCVWVADSFEGLPPPDAVSYPADEDDKHYRYGSALAVSVDEVKENFRRFGLLDDNVRFLKGWFRDTLTSAPIERLSILRLDGDMYGSTIESLRALYAKLSPGGFVIVDDYGAVDGCRMAVDDFRRENAVAAPLEAVDWSGVFWRKD